MVELPQAGQMLLATKSPSTSIPSNGEEQVFHGQEPQQKKGWTWVKLCHPPLLSSCPTLWLPMTAPSKTGKGGGWKTEAIAAFSAHYLPWEGPDTWVYSGGIFCTRPSFTTFFFFSSRKSKKIVSEWQFGLLGFSGFYFSPLGDLCQLLLHAYETHNFQPFLTGVK